MTPNYEPLFYWVRAREAARIKRAAYDLASPGVVPYFSDDPIIREWRFCNVRREDDRVTIWIRQNIREPYAEHPLLWLMLCLARQINWPPTLRFLIDTLNAWPADKNFSPEQLAKTMNVYKDAGNKLYTGAYMISAPSTKGADKQEYIAQVVIGKLWEAREKFAKYFARTGQFAPTVRETHELISAYNGWGDFMTYQAVGDLLFTKLLENANDKDRWCAAGPGTIRGLNRIYGRPVDHKLSQADARAEIRATWVVIREATGVDMAFNDVPNCYCETDKYLRVKQGEGTPRARFVPGKGY